jgi:hypothetical protein
MWTPSYISDIVRKESVVPYFEMKGAPGAFRIALVARAKSSEILGCSRHHVRKQLNDNPSFHVSPDADVHEHSRIWLRRDYYIHSSIRFFSIIHAQILHRFHGHVDPRRTRTAERNSSNPPRQNPPSNSTVALSHLTLEGSNNIPTLQPVKLILYILPQRLPTKRLGLKSPSPTPHAKQKKYHSPIVDIPFFSHKNSLLCHITCHNSNLPPPSKPPPPVFCLSSLHKKAKKQLHRFRRRQILQETLPHRSRLPTKTLRGL